MKRLWLTWEEHRRTRELSASIPGLTLEVCALEAPRHVRYPRLLARSLWILLRERPRLLLVQNPSLVLTSGALLLSMVLGYRLVVDAHNEGIAPFHERHRRFLPLYRLLQRGADLTVVTNPGLEGRVLANGGRPCVLPDRIPAFSPPVRRPKRAPAQVVCITTYEKDEPFEAVIAAARLLDPGVALLMTGDSRKAPQGLIQGAPEAVHFTGFLSETDYRDLLFSSDVVMDLTLMEDCLVCGAYEAVALGRPMILSDTRALRAYFSQGAVYADNTPEGIAQAIGRALENLGRLEREVVLLRERLVADWHRRFEAFLGLLERLEVQKG